MPKLQVATRKGLFTIEQNGAGSWSITDTAFIGMQVTMSLADPRSGHDYAALSLGHFGAKLHRRNRGSSEWQEIAVPKYPEDATLPERMADPTSTEPPKQKPASLSEIWCLETGGPDEDGLLWAGTIPGGLFRSRDHGDSWELIQSLWDRPERQFIFGGGKDDPGIHSICVDPRDRRHVSLAISCGGVWVTRDGGENWDCRGQGLRAEYLPPDQAYNPVPQDPHRMVSCPAAPDALWIQHHNGIFRSTDDCESWQEIKDVQPAVFGFAVAVHPADPNTAWFVPGVKDETRVPVDGRLVVTKTTDGGQSFAQITTGLPQQHAYDVVFRHALDVDATGNRLAMGSTTGNFWISEDGGESWQCVSTNLPPVFAVRWVE